MPSSISRRALFAALICILPADALARTSRRSGRSRGGGLFALMLLAGGGGIALVVGAVGWIANASARRAEERWQRERAEWAERTKVAFRERMKTDP